MTTTQTPTQTPTPTNPGTDRRPSAWTSVRAQIAAAGVILALLVLGPRWDGAPDELTDLLAGLPTPLTDLPLWGAAVGALVTVLATVSLVVSRRR